MDTIARVMELADERNLSLFKLSQLCDVSYSSKRQIKGRVDRYEKIVVERIEMFHHY